MPDTGVTQDVLLKWLLQSPPAMWAGLVVRYVPAFIGAVLLFLLVIRRKAGAPDDPPRAPGGPTRPFPALETLTVLGVAVFFSLLLAQALLFLPVDLATSLAFRMLSMQAALLLVAVAVFFGRRRQQAASSLVSSGSILVAALKTVCLASIFVVPLALLSTVALHLLGIPNLVYGPILEFMTAPDTHRPWLVAGSAVFLAPIGEEAVFRGLLYPAIRGTTGERWRVVLAAVVVSLLFALIHWHAANFLPLFALAMVLTWLFERTNSLVGVMVAHGIWNLLTLVPLILRITL